MAAWIIFERRRRADGSPGEGSVACISCGAREEIDACASETEGDELHASFAHAHTLCGDTQIVARRHRFDAEPDSNAHGAHL